MGREIRLVPPNWAHPTKDYPNHHLGRMEPGYQPMYDESYESACDRWKKEYAAFYEKGEDKEQKCEYWDWNGNPPNKEYYRLYKDTEATWFQLYETVSEGTPVSPPFQTKEELADYLAENGDFWDQKRRKEGTSLMECRPWGKEQAYKFVMGAGWAPSFVFEQGKGLMSGVEAMTQDKK